MELRNDYSLNYNDCYKLCFHNDNKQVYYTTSTDLLNVGPGQVVLYTSI